MQILENGVAVIEGDTHHAVWCQTEGLVHDKFMAGIITAAIKDHQVSNAIDAGAHIGTLTIPMLQAGCMVIAIEPNPAAVKCLCHNARNFDNIHIIQAGVGEKAEMRPFRQAPNAGASRVCSEFSGLECMIVPIDSLNSKAGLIKMDIEGMELAALKGAVKTIEKNRPILIMEINAAALKEQGDSPEILLAWLTEANYAFRVLQPDCHFGNEQFDIMATPR